MTKLTDSVSYLRRGQDFPVLVVSQDYELYFESSGSIEKCLFEPCDLLLDYADTKGIRITFFIDAGMLCAMERLAPESASMARDLSRVKSHISSLVTRGHEIGLHIHPHWEDAQWSGGAWDFAGTRYQLRDFSDTELTDVVGRYTGVLNDLCDGSVLSYRAGGFCVEPFGRLRNALLGQGITIDSSVVPGLRIRDDDKGVDFRGSPNTGWWYFDESPLIPDETGPFLEIPITPQVLPLLHYWGRAVERVLGRKPATAFGDGTSKAIGRTEIIRRLTGRGRTSELSMDAPKAAQLAAARTVRQERNIWHVMGHPKLLGKSSQHALDELIDRKAIHRFESVSTLASAIHAQRPPSAPS